MPSYNLAMLTNEHAAQSQSGNGLLAKNRHGSQNAKKDNRKVQAWGVALAVYSG